MDNKRHDGRLNDQIRPIEVFYDAYGYADASVLLSWGKTIVASSVTLQQTVPPFLKGQRVGWLSAEYAMLPCATHQRSARESSQVYKNARSVEISRLIGRSLRTVVSLDKIGEQTITVDCDVLQADGGTRVASITAASLALALAARRWVAWGVIKENVFTEHVIAVSAGILRGMPVVDLAYQEDSIADADFNFVLTQSGNVIEVQGTAEKVAVSWQQFEEIKNLVISSTKEIFNVCRAYELPEIDSNASSQQANAKNSRDAHASKRAFFSLANRLTKSS